MLSGYGARVANTFGEVADTRLIHTWRRNRKETDSMKTDTSQIVHISITLGWRIFETWWVLGWSNKISAKHVNGLSENRTIGQFYKL